MNEAKPELLRGTLDMLILKIVALGPIHGYASLSASSKSRRTFSKFSKARSIPRFIAWKTAAGSLRTGANPKPDATQSFTRQPGKAAGSWRPSSFIGSVSPTP
jgi:hypothetical protein